MDEIRLKNFRCFREAQRARLAPLTLLVGENSTGKTSFMAMIRALWNAAHGLHLGFKEPPYDLGSFDEMAHYRGGKTGRSDSFEAGFDANARSLGRSVPSDARQYRFDAVFSRRGTIPAKDTWRVASEDVWVGERLDSDSSRWLCFGTPSGEWRRQLPSDDEKGPSSDYRFLVSLSTSLAWSGHDPGLVPVGDSPSITEADKKRLNDLTLVPVLLMPLRPFASAPVRSKPLRTYDPSDPSSDPEGANVPMYLSTAFFDDKKGWDALKSALEEFGHDAGLFDEVSVRPLGKRGSEPFQVYVRKYARRAKGPMRNLIDVGYGVSQVLPVITELFRERATRMFLLQQPEVHLHPSAQAALGSLFCRIAAGERQLVVETHSDHLVDRVRMDVRDGSAQLKPEDVSILYFERRDLDVRIHSLCVDERGNVLGAPPSYRRFFMEETRKSLGL